jgi:hypothetical protein
MIEIIEKVKLGVSNRDGDLFAVKSRQGTCYLILEADTFHNKPEFDGMGSVESIEITSEAYSALNSG